MDQEPKGGSIEELTFEQRAKFCSTMLEKYGVKLDVDNEMLPMYYVAYQSALFSEETVKKFEASAKRTNEGLRQMVLDFDTNLNNLLERFNTRLKKVETKQYRFNSPKEAFMFTLGHFGLPVIGVALFLFLSFMYYQSQVVPQQREAYLRYWIENGEYVEINRSHAKISTIRLYEVEGFEQAVAGKNYVYNPECECIEVPLYFVNKSK